MASEDNLFCQHSRTRFWSQLQCNEVRLKLQNSPVAVQCHTICRIPGYLLKPSSSDEVMLAFRMVLVQRFGGQQKNMPDVRLIPGLRVPPFPSPP